MLELCRGNGPNSILRICPALGAARYPESMRETYVGDLPPNSQSSSARAT